MYISCGIVIYVVLSSRSWMRQTPSFTTLGKKGMRKIMCGVRRGEVGVHRAQSGGMN